MKYTEEQVEALVAAMAQLLDDMSENGQSVCLQAKKQAIVAFEPFRLSDEEAA